MNKTSQFLTLGAALGSDGNFYGTTIWGGTGSSSVPILPMNNCETSQL